MASLTNGVYFHFFCHFAKLFKIVPFFCESIWCVSASVTYLMLFVYVFVMVDSKTLNTLDS